MIVPKGPIALQVLEASQHGSVSRLRFEGKVPAGAVDKTFKEDFKYKNKRVSSVTVAYCPFDQAVRGVRGSPLRLSTDDASSVAGRLPHRIHAWQQNRARNQTGRCRAGAHRRPLRWCVWAVGRVTRSAAARALGWQEDERPYSDFCLILGMPTRRCAALTCRSRKPVLWRSHHCVEALLIHLHLTPRRSLLWTTAEAKRPCRNEQNAQDLVAQPPALRAHCGGAPALRWMDAVRYAVVASAHPGGLFAREILSHHIRRGGL